jgi:hypothetical protein
MATTTEAPLPEDVEAGRVDPLLPRPQPHSPARVQNKAPRKSLLISPGKDVGESWVQFISVVAEKAAPGGSKRRPLNPFLRRGRKRELASGNAVPSPVRLSPKAPAGASSQFKFLSKFRGRIDSCKAESIATASTAAHTPISDAENPEASRINLADLQSPPNRRPHRLAREGSTRTPRGPPRVSYVGMALNGLGVILSGYGPFGAGGAKHLIKELLINPSEPVLPGKRYRTTVNDLAIHLLVDEKNRVFACVTSAGYSLMAVYCLLADIQQAYHANLNRLRPFSTREMCYQRILGPTMKDTQQRYERIERDPLFLERESRMRENMLERVTCLKYSSSPSTERARHMTALNISTLEHLSEDRATSSSTKVLLITSLAVSLVASLAILLTLLFS